MNDADDKALYLKNQKARNLAIAGGLVAFVLIVFFVTMVKMGQNTRPTATKPTPVAGATNTIER